MYIKKGKLIYGCEVDTYEILFVVQNKIIYSF